LLLPEADLDNAVQVASKIHEAIRTYNFGTSTNSFKLTVSVGVSSTTTRFYSDWRQMLKDADQALYVAKNAGKDRIEVCATEKTINSILAPSHP